MIHPGMKSGEAAPPETKAEMLRSEEPVRASVLTRRLAKPGAVLTSEGRKA
jgi:hypothetical protein